CPMFVPFAPSRLSPLPPAPPSRLSRVLRSSRRNSFRNNTCKPIPRFSRNRPLLTLLESALTKFASATPLESALTKNAGRGGPTSLSPSQPLLSTVISIPYAPLLRPATTIRRSAASPQLLFPFPLHPSPLIPPPRPRQLDRAAPRTLHSSCIFPGRLHARGGHRRRRLSRLASLRSPHRRRLGRAFSRQPRHRRRLQRRPSPQASA